MQKKKRFVLFVLFCLSFLLLSGCSLLLKTEADQTGNGEKKTEQAEKKLTSEEVLNNTLENLQKAPGLHYTLSFKNEVFIEQQHINSGNFCMKLEIQQGFEPMRFCYESPYFSVKLNDQPPVTFDMSSNTEQDVSIQVIKTMMLGEMGNPKTVLTLAQESKPTMEEQNGMYVLKGKFSEERYVDALAEACQNHELLNRMENFQDELTKFEDDVRSDGDDEQLQFEIKVDQQNLQLKEIKMIDSKGEEMKIEIKGEISDLDMNGMKL